MKGKLELFNDTAETILSKEDNEVFYDIPYYNLMSADFLNETPGTIKTKLKAKPQVIDNVNAIMEKWYGLQQKCIDNNERFYGYYFDEETDRVYRLTGMYLSNFTSIHPIDGGTEIELSFNYDDKKEIN